MWLKSPKISPLGNSTGVKHLKIKNGPLQKMDIKIFYEFCKILKGREARKGNQNFLSNVQLRLLPKLWPFLSTTPCWWLTTGHCRAETMSSGLPSSRNCAPQSTQSTLAVWPLQHQLLPQQSWSLILVTIDKEEQEPEGWTNIKTGV